MGIRVKIRKKIKQKNYYRELSIVKNKILFRTVSGSYTCNAKYIAEEIIRQKLPYELVWIVNGNVDKFEEDFPKEIRLVCAKTAQDFYEHATAKIWIDNERRNCYIQDGLFKRQEQRYIQTFHGSFGIKKTGPDRDLSATDMEIMEIDSKMIDYLTSNGTWTTAFLKRMFPGDGKILKFGHPRNDVFFKDGTKIRDKVCTKLNIAPSKNILLYAPTFRDDGTMCYSLDYGAVLSGLKGKFGGEWIALARVHPRFADLNGEIIPEGESIVNATWYSDMNELLVAADVTITDYSSSIYDFMLSAKPGFIYAEDVDKYEKMRGLYYPLESTPFPVARNNAQLLENIKKFDANAYAENVRLFLKSKGSVESGVASEKVVELIKKIIAEEEGA
jgi:CDP-glycerol glycerophosphotransferase